MSPRFTWCRPSGHGEDPPPVGSLVRVNASGGRHVIATGLIDPVWVAGSSDGLYGYVGLFHTGAVVRVSLSNGTVTTVAAGLSCPEGVALDHARGYLFVVENPVRNGCRSITREWRSIRFRLAPRTRNASHTHAGPQHVWALSTRGA